MKIVTNTCYGGYGLSEAAYRHLGIKWDGYGYEFERDRDNPKLVECVEKLGDAANGFCASLKVVEIPDGTKYEIEEYDGIEEVAEYHRRWS